MIREEIEHRNISVILHPSSHEENERIVTGFKGFKFLPSRNPYILLSERIAEKHLDGEFNNSILFSFSHSEKCQLESLFKKPPGDKYPTHQKKKKQQPLFDRFKPLFHIFPVEIIHLIDSFILLTYEGYIWNICFPLLDSKMSIIYMIKYRFLEIKGNRFKDLNLSQNNRKFKKINNISKKSMKEIRVEILRQTRSISIDHGKEHTLINRIRGMISSTQEGSSSSTSSTEETKKKTEKKKIISFQTKAKPREGSIFIFSVFFKIQNQINRIHVISLLTPEFFSKKTDKSSKKNIVMKNLGVLIHDFLGTNPKKKILQSLIREDLNHDSQILMNIETNEIH